ncbi:hypothetical protein A4R29_05340 [Mesorhizobium ciceri biovar biserrulae]|nr:hypothetical protein A4R29_05340 [Mesorhizobium ciceri biovar biserrulae]
MSLTRFQLFSNTTYGNRELICSQSPGTVTEIYQDQIDEIVGSAGTVEDTNHEGSIGSGHRYAGVLSD